MNHQPHSSFSLDDFLAKVHAKDHLPPYIEVRCESADCKNLPSTIVARSDFAEWIDRAILDCEACHSELHASGLLLTCYICGTYIDFDSLADAKRCLEGFCPHCAEAPPFFTEEDSVVVADSWAHYYGAYSWDPPVRGVKELERKNRNDYWEGLVHFCDAKGFISIYKGRRIKAFPTGLYIRKHPDNAKAVCLTEATVPNWNELKAAHGEYGFIFRKRDIIKIGGAPAIYIPDSVVDQMKVAGEEIPKTLWPYLNKLKITAHSNGKRHDFLHEREWRVPGDIHLDAVRPYAVTFPKQPRTVDVDELIFRAALEFFELDH